MDGEILCCPGCSSDLDHHGEHSTCERCGFGLTTRGGVYSVTSPSCSRPEADQTGHRLEEFADSVETASIDDATRRLSTDPDDRLPWLRELYDVRRHEWRVLVEQYIEGRCLDLNAGFGTRSILLSDLADSVCAVDRELAKLRVLAARDDVPTDCITPVYTDEGRLPFPDGSFDTIVAETAAVDSGYLESFLAELDRYLKGNGTLILVASGWPRRVAKSLRTRSLLDLLSAPIPATPNTYRTLLEAVGYNHVETYALFPTSEKVRYVFDVESDPTTHLLPEVVLPDEHSYTDLGKVALSLGQRIGLLERCCPSYLIVCADSNSVNNFGFSNPILVSGRARSVVLDTAKDGIQDVWKVPNWKSHAAFTERENEIVSALQARDSSVRETLPKGESVETRFGVVRREEPVDGTSLQGLLDRDPEAFRRILEIGYDWLVQFQSTFRGPTVDKDPKEIRSELAVDPVGLRSPTYNKSVRTFHTPVHGDYLPKNIYYNDGGVTKVIDWEYGATADCPIVDAGNLLLYTMYRTFGGFEKGFQAIFKSETAFASHARECVRAYCDALQLPYRTFEVYLPYAYIHRIQKEFEYGSVARHTPLMENLSEYVRYLWKNRDEICFR